MKVSAINIYPVGFTSNKNSVAKENFNQPQQKNKNYNKAITYGLLGVTAFGGVILLLNNLRKGKVKPIDITDGKGLTKETYTDEAKKGLDYAMSWLDPKNYPEINADTIDRYLVPQKPNKELAKLNDWYKSLEAESDEAIAAGKKAKAYVERVFGAKIDRLGSIDEMVESGLMDAVTRADKTEFYTKWAQEAEAQAIKEAKKAEMLKLKEENPQEYARLKKERVAAQKAAKKAEKAEAISKSTTKITLPSGEEAIERIIPVKGGKIKQVTSADGSRLISETQYGKDKIVHTIYNGDTKSVYIRENKIDSMLDITKTYQKGENGKWELVSRQVDNSDAEIVKTVKRLENGNTQIMEEDSRVIKLIERDKKGNIIDEKTIIKANGDGAPKAPPADPGKVLAPWFIEYQRLCQKYGVTPRACGVKGGAWDHFYELNLRENDPEAYRYYISTRNYRAGYNENARLMQMLDDMDVANLRLETLTEKDVKLLKEYLKNSNLDSEVVAQIRKLLDEYAAMLAERAARQREHVYTPQTQGVLVYA